MAMEKQRDLAKELVKLCGLVRGSIVHTTRKCGRAQCECAKGKQHPFCYLSRSSAGSKNKIQYVKPSEEKAFERAVAMYERAWSIIEELTELNIKEIKEYSGPRKLDKAISVKDIILSPTQGGLPDEHEEAQFYA